MPDENDSIYDSASPEPGDDFWLEQGRKMVEESLTAVREAAKSLMTGLGLLKGIYLGILGFSGYIPENMPLQYKILYLLPLILWLIALYSCMNVMKTGQFAVNLFSPDDIRDKSNRILVQKQKNLERGFWTLTAGIVIAVLLFVFRCGSVR